MKKKSVRVIQKKIRWNPLAILLVLALLFAAAFLYAVDSRYPFIWMYLADKAAPQPAVTGPTHVMFLYVDHFEPHDQPTMDRWMKHYPELASKHRDADGRHPQRSWFWYFAESDDEESLSFLRQLSDLSYRGFGEVELHFHHWADTEATLAKKIEHALNLSKVSGALITNEPRPRTVFSFIHGLWGLDNSRGAGACGVNSEILLLKKLGCYGEFTHPSWGKMHPRTVNRLYYVTDDPSKPKSYDFGPEMEAGKRASGDLLLFEGPSVLRWKGMRPVYDHGEIGDGEAATPERIRDWIETRIHVKGRPEWTFVKVFSHGALEADHEEVLADDADKLYTHLEQNYNDGEKYILHYVTAREAYNIAKAAEAGEEGNPNDYRDYIIPRYMNNLLTVSAPYETLSSNPGKLVLQFSQGQGPVEIRLRGTAVQVSGDAAVGSVKEEAGESLITITPNGRGVVGFDYKEPVK